MRIERLLVVLALAGLASHALAQAYVPDGDARVLQAVPAASDPAVRAMDTLRAAALARPRDPPAALALARAYVDYGRKVGDARYAGYAEAVIAPFLAREPAEAPVLAMQATILQYRHRFGEARALLERALARDPRNVQAWLTLATLDMVRGEHARAADGCAQVAKSGGAALGLACRGNLALYTGHAAQGVAMLASLDTQLPAAYRPWIEGLLAEGCERLGRWQAAEAHHLLALRAAPGDNFLLVAYADFLLDRGRPAEVVTLLEPALDSDTAYLRIALAHAALGSREASRHAWVMAARFAAYEQRGDETFGREQARFALSVRRDPRGALDIARRNFEAQREPWDVRILLEAAVAARDPAAAAQALAFVARSKLEDPAIAALVATLGAAP